MTNINTSGLVKLGDRIRWNYSVGRRSFLRHGRVVYLDGKWLPGQANRFHAHPQSAHRYLGKIADYKYLIAVPADKGRDHYYAPRIGDVSVIGEFDDRDQ